jgi:hypothetical protein
MDYGTVPSFPQSGNKFGMTDALRQTQCPLASSVPGQRTLSLLKVNIKHDIL